MFIVMRLYIMRSIITFKILLFILPAVQVNIRAGSLPEPEDNGTRYLKIPLGVL